MITQHLLIHGLVQGVFFRESMRQRARQLGVTGWVRNRADGSVEATVKGEAEAVAAIIEWARHGPDGANVADLKSEDSDGNYTAFETLPTL